jgi:hypothetical protein
MVNRLVCWMRRRVAAMERRRVAAERRQIIRDVCSLAGVPRMGEEFISRGFTPESVVHEMARCSRSRPS